MKESKLPPKNKSKKKFPVEEFIPTDNGLNSIRLRTELAISILSALSDHESDHETQDETDLEAIAVLLAVTAYVCQEYDISQTNMIKELKHLYKQNLEAAKRLGPRGTARDFFTELAVMAEED